MRRAAAQRLVERNADRCEAAISKRCRCACNGALHGVKHSAEWRREQIEALADPELELEARIE